MAGRSLSLGRAVLPILATGYTSQPVPILRAMHEANRLLATFLDPDEESLLRRWLADQAIDAG